MKKFVFVFIVLCGILCFVVACSKSEDVPKVASNIYFVDSELNRLVPYSRKVIDAQPEYAAKNAIEILIEGEDENSSIRRLIPYDKDCISVRVTDNVAYVNISSEIKESLPYSRDIEKLFIYQIVNTLTELDGIRFVKFNVDGTVKKDFMGFYDMRETYKYTYPE